MAEQDKSVNTSDINAKLLPRIASLDELNTYLRVRFPSHKEKGQVVGMSDGRVRQILNGYKLPKSAKLIKRLADGWGIDAVNLSLIFSNVRISNSEKLREEKT